MALYDKFKLSVVCFNGLLLMALAALVAGLGFFQLFDYLMNGTEIKSVWKMVYEMLYVFYAIWNGRMVYGIVKGNPVLIEEWLFLWKFCMTFLLPFFIYEAFKMVVIIFSVKAQLDINWRFTTQYLFLLVTGEWANEIYKSLKIIPFDLAPLLGARRDTSVAPATKIIPFQPGERILIRIDNQEKGSSSEPTKKFTCKV